MHVGEYGAMCTYWERVYCRGINLDKYQKNDGIGLDIGVRRNYMSWYR